MKISVKVANKLSKTFEVTFSKKKMCHTQVYGSLSNSDESISVQWSDILQKRVNAAEKMILLD